MTIRALVVDDSLQLRRSVMYALQKVPNLLCVEAGDGAEALRKLRGSHFDIILTDINMPVMDGLTLLSRIRESHPLLRSVIVSAYGDMANIRTAMWVDAFRSWHDAGI